MFVLFYIGTLHHRVGSVLPKENEPPKFAQIYILDNQQQIKRRLELNYFNNDNFNKNPRNKTIAGKVITKLQNVIETNNPYVKQFKQGYEQCKNKNIPQLTIQIHEDMVPVNEHERRYNKPVNEAVAIIIPSDPIDIADRQIQLTYKDDALKFISETHALYDPLSYPLLFPFGTTGYHKNIIKYTHKSTQKFQTLSYNEYYQYRLMIRDNEYGLLRKSGRLFQQYCVDMYAKNHQYQVNWYKCNQKKIRAELYKGLQDAINANDVHNAGVRVILPSGYVGGPRWYNEKFHNSMAIVNVLGRASFFITFTVNLQWREIQENLGPGETPNDRPDLVARVFKLKLQAFIDDIMKNGVLGRAIAKMVPVECQKNHVHGHGLYILIQEDRLNPNDVDRVIWAEIPDRNKFPKLFAYKN